MANKAIFKNPKNFERVYDADQLVRSAIRILDDVVSSERGDSEAVEGVQMLRELLAAIRGECEIAPPGWYQWPWGTRPHLDYHMGVGSEVHFDGIISQGGTGLDRREGFPGGLGFVPTDGRNP